VNNKIVRVLPVLDEHCNEEWLSNKARFSLDALSSQRLLYPKLLSQGSYNVISWPRALYLYLQQLFFTPQHSLQAICSHFLDLPTALMVKNFFHSFGCSNVFYENLFYRKTDFRSFYLFGATLLALESSSFFLLIALNLRLEAPLLNSRLRKNYQHNLTATRYYSLGLALDYLTFPVSNLGSSVRSLFSFLEGKLPSYSTLFSASFFRASFLHFPLSQLQRPFILMGSSFFYRKDANALASSCFSLRNYGPFLSFGIYFIPDYLGKISFFDSVFHYRFNKVPLSARSFVLLLEGHSQRPFHFSPLACNSFLVFQGSYKNSLAYNANLLLPVKAQGEHTFSYFNLNGYWKTSKAALTAFRLVFSHLEIFSILNITRKRFFLSNFSWVKDFFSLVHFFSSFITHKAYFLGESFVPGLLLERYLGFKEAGIAAGVSVAPTALFFRNKLVNSLFSKLIHNYYSNNIYSKNSKVMSLCATKVSFSTFSFNQYFL
jgi:hypothetical protein